jgi:hypothetical protein
LRQLGRNPNASKIEVMTVEDFQARRHREVNLRIDAAKKAGDRQALDAIIKDWSALDRKQTPSWDKVARKIYSIARQAGIESTSE